LIIIFIDIIGSFYIM